jgi:hypothetical protein
MKLGRLSLATQPVDPIRLVKRAPDPLLKFTVRVILLGLIVIILGVTVEFVLSRLPHRVGNGSGTLKVLFIRNSYIFVNNLPGLLIELSAREAKPVDTEMVVEGGSTLSMHWHEGKALDAIQRTKWDYVVLQEQSTLGSDAVINGIAQLGNPASFWQYARLFDAAIRKNGAKTVLFMTWARKNAPQTQVQLTNAYTAIANELHAIVAPVGLAWQDALTKKPGFVLFDPDGSHPNAAGSYLAACVFYATLYQKTPVGLPIRLSNTLIDDSGTPQSGIVNLTSADALFLQQSAWAVVPHPK